MTSISRWDCWAPTGLPSGSQWSTAGGRTATRRLRSRSTSCQATRRSHCSPLTSLTTRWTRNCHCGVAWAAACPAACGRGPSARHAPLVRTRPRRRRRSAPHAARASSRAHQAACSARRVRRGGSSCPRGPRWGTARSAPLGTGAARERIGADLAQQGATPRARAPRSAPFVRRGRTGRWRGPRTGLSASRAHQARSRPRAAQHASRVHAAHTPTLRPRQRALRAWPATRWWSSARRGTIAQLARLGRTRPRRGRRTVSRAHQDVLPTHPLRPSARHALQGRTCSPGRRP